MRILLNCGEFEKSYRGPIASWMSKNNAAAQVTYGPRTLDELLVKVDIYQMDIIVVSCSETFYNLVGKNRGTQQDWAGSVLWLTVPVLLISPLAQVQSMPQGHFLLHQHLNKIPSIIKKRKPEQFDWKIVTTHSTAKFAVAELEKAEFIVEDIETSRHNGITSIAFTPISKDLTIGTTWVFNLAVKDLYPLWKYCRTINANNVKKIFHNGCFDAFHLCRWYMPPRNYWLDTEYMWHSWYAELKMSLAFVSNTVLWDARYWKYEAAEAPLEYNAKDTINTARIFIYMLQNMPDWAWRNYSKLVPNIAPAVWCSFEGFKVDRDELEAITQKAIEYKAKLLKDLKDMTAWEDFNPGSPQQVSRWLYDILRAKKPRKKRGESDSATGVKQLARVAMQHPLYAWIISTILQYRSVSKAISTYYTARLTEGGRLLYALNIAGTETERLACTASSLYAPLIDRQTLSSQQNFGTQLQNIPGYMKVVLRADDGFMLINIDKSKSEAYCTAKLSKDAEFENDLHGELDFYIALGNRLFGLNITDKEDPLRKVFKKINHSTSYMAGGESLLDSIGPSKIFKYMQLLGYKGTALSFANFCITSLLKKYPKRKQWWDATRTFAKNFGYIETPDGHRRLVFAYGKNEITHAILRGLVAHQPQHLSVAGINEAFWKLWYNVQLESNGEYRLKGQVHDSIVSQAITEKIKHYAEVTKATMDIIQPTDFGDLRIPLDVETSFYWKEAKQ